MLPTNPEAFLELVSVRTGINPRKPEGRRGRGGRRQALVRMYCVWYLHNKLNLSPSDIAFYLRVTSANVEYYLRKLRTNGTPIFPDWLRIPEPHSTVQETGIAEAAEAAAIA